MTHMAQVTFDNYTRAGDVAVIGVCFVMLVLLVTSYVSRTRSFRIFTNIIAVLVTAALVNICFHELLRIGNPAHYTLISILHILYQALLLDVFCLFALYTTVVSGLDHRKSRLVAVAFTAVLVVFVGADIVMTALGSGFRIENGRVVTGPNLFMIAYVVFLLMMVVLLTRVRTLLFKRVMYGFFGTMAVSVLIFIGQLALGHSSLTTLTFVFPVIAMLYIMHSNPYDVALGSVDIRAMEDMVRIMHMRKADFIFLSLLLPEFDVEGKELPEELKAQVRRFSSDFFRSCVLFQIGNGHVVLMAPLRKNPDYEHRIASILGAFDQQYRRLHYTYKTVIGRSIEDISRKNEYASFIRSINDRLPDNTVHRVEPDDITRFNKNEYILSELADIYNKQDVNDPRVLAFCQPVFNLRTGQFDTAEALMRLRLEKIGLVFPDQFIPLAESHGYIHVLTEIILNKTCREIRKLTDEGFRINRISVNVSVLELKDEAFCNDINRIVDGNGIAGENIAIEITESNSEADFLVMKQKIDELRREGIQFYLDDFGTGYSNMERIMELPFDIIKFDRSMVIASGSDSRSEKIVENLANMFKDMEYSVLYEGVEDESDEERCKAMSASYLQGYMYSRPVPIENLRSFLPKAG